MIHTVKFNNLFSCDYKDNCSQAIALWFGKRLFVVLVIGMVILEFFMWPLISTEKELSTAGMLVAQAFEVLFYSFIGTFFPCAFLAIGLQNLGKTHICES